jgi:hypothetical protein
MKRPADRTDLTSYNHPHTILPLHCLTFTQQFAFSSDSALTGQDMPLTIQYVCVCFNMSCSARELISLRF